MDFLKKLLEDTDEQAVKTYPSKKEWNARFKQIDKMADDVSKIVGKMFAMKKGLWSEIELELNEFGSMKHNVKTNEIEVMGEKEKSIKSPFFEK